MKKITTFLAVCISFSLYAQVNLTSGLVAYFQMNGAGNDTSVTNIDGTLNGTTPIVGINGGASTALHFTAANNDKFTAGTSNRGITNTVSISCWFRTSATGLQHLVEKYDWNTDKGFALDIYNQKICLLGRNGTGNYYEFYGTTVVTDGQWHHVVGIMDDNVWSIYLDCAFQSTLTTTSGTIANSAAYLALGYYYVGNAGNYLHLDGDMDEVRIYNRVLNTAEINYLCVAEYTAVIENSVSGNLDVFPNPVTDQFSIHTSGANENWFIKVYDSFGKVVLKEPYSESSFSTGKLASGVYLVEVSDNHGEVQARNKFIKK
jgi:hypothetical protein